MTTTTTTRARRAGGSTRTAPGRSRTRRTRQAASGLTRAGRPVRSALLRVPFVIALIVVLAVGVGGVLYLNTKIDESGMRTEQAKAASAQLRLEIEALHRSIADLTATPRIAERAEELGLVPVGDAAMLVIKGNGSAKLLGKPAPVDARTDVRAGGR